LLSLIFPPHISSSLVNIRLHPGNQLPRLLVKALKVSSDPD
jgi:hypothetical protein